MNILAATIDEQLVTGHAGMKVQLFSFTLVTVAIGSIIVFCSSKQPAMFQVHVSTRGGRTCVIIASYLYIPVCIPCVLYSICTLYRKAWLNASWRISPSYSCGSDKSRTWFHETWWVCAQATYRSPHTSLVHEGGYYKCTAVFFFRSVTAWPLKQRSLWARDMEWCFSCWYGVSPVGFCLPSVNRRCCCKVMSSKRSAVSRWSSRPSTKEETRG